MSKLKRIALAGRRNAGKSTLLNALIGYRRAITDQISGLTRDIIEEEVHRDPYHFIISDTPGLDIENPDQLESAILERARAYLAETDGIIVLLEAPYLSSFDYSFIDLMRRELKNKPVVFAVNKIDGAELAGEAMEEFYRAGLADAIPVSAKARWNFPALLEALAEKIPAVKIENYTPSKNALRRKTVRSKDAPEENEQEIPGDGILNLAIVGRPNSGKSSLLNRLSGKEIALVSSIPGTTRDSLDTVIRFHGTEIRIIDTAGLRRVQRLKGETKDIEFYSMARTDRAIRSADVVIHVIDAKEGITENEKKITDRIIKEGKASVLAVNKWDSVENKDTSAVKNYTQRIDDFFPMIKHVPKVFISALTGQRLPKLIETALEVKSRLDFRIPTAKLNKMIEVWNQTFANRANKPKILYAVQTETNPPHFVFFVKSRKSTPDSIISFFENRIRQDYSLGGIPVRITIRERESDV